MQIKSTYLKKIILEGCNGEWAQECYLPVLIKKAAGGEIQLWAVDIEDSMKLGSLPVKKEWQVAQSENGAHYLNKNRDRQTYSALSNAGYVFVVVPDQSHCQIAEFWLDRLAPKGKIFIEKPLDANLSAALQLKEKIEAKRRKEAVFAFDHYLARAYPFLLESNRYLEQIGGAKKIEFHILEKSKISAKRKKTLDKGVIFDLFCHVLALTCAVTSHNLTCLETKLRAVKLNSVKAAQYNGCPISGETFAWIKAFINHGIEIVSAVGKCVGTSEDKFMKLYGLNGNIKLDFVDDEFSVFDSQGKQQKHGKLDEKHVETFLEGILHGKTRDLMVAGVLSFDAALAILKLLDEAKKRIDEMPEYQRGESTTQVLERF